MVGVFNMKIRDLSQFNKLLIIFILIIIFSLSVFAKIINEEAENKNSQIYLNEEVEQNNLIKLKNISIEIKKSDNKQIFSKFDLPSLNFEKQQPPKNQVSIKYFQNEKDLKVIITLKQPIEINEWTSKIKLMDSKKVDGLKNTMREYLIKEINHENVKHQYNSFNGFSAIVSIEKYDELINNPLVKSVSIDKKVYATIDDSVGIINASRTWGVNQMGTNLSGFGQSVCVIDSGVDYTHADLGGCTPSVTSSRANSSINNIYSPNYPGEYTNNYDYTWTITKPGYDGIAVYFSEIDIEEGYDLIYILDSDNNYVALYSGTYSGSFWSPVVEGDTIKVRFISDDYDEGGPYNGFKVTMVTDATTDSNLDWSGCGKVIGGHDFANIDSDPMDDEGHGTHVAGIIAADGGKKGVSPSSKIVAIKSLDSDGSGWSSDIIAGIEYCTSKASEFNISVISMSLGDNNNYTTYCDENDTSYAAAINSAVSNGISVIISAGNSGSFSGISSPGCIQNAIPVSATTKADVIDNLYAQRNSLVNLLAPGSVIFSTQIGGGYVSSSGTSMAAPHVAGAFAIMNQYLDSKSLTRTPSQIESIFDTTGKQITDISYSGLTYSRIDVYEAIKSFNTAPVLTSAQTNETYVKSSTNIKFSSDVTGDSLLSVMMNGTSLSGDLVNGGTFYTINTTSDFGCFGIEGSCNFEIIANDYLYEESNAGSIDIFVDDIAPRINDKEMIKYYFKNNEVAQFVVNVTDQNLSTISVCRNFASASTSCSSESASFNDGIFNGNVILTKDVSNFSITVTDEAGNENITYFLNSTNYFVDDINPTVWAVSYNDSTIGLSKEITIYANVTDNIDVFNVSVQYGSNNPIIMTAVGNVYSVSTSANSLGITSTGNHSVKIVAYDNVSNINESTLVYLDVDASVPFVTNATSNITYSRSNVSINFSVFVSDTSLTSVTLNGTNMTGDLSNGGIFYTINTTAEFGCQAIENTCLFTISASDYVGNINNSQDIIITIDDLNPIVNSLEIDDLDNQINSSQEIIISANISDYNISSVTINGLSLSLNSGLYYITENASNLGCSQNSICDLTVIVSDSAGNKNDYLNEESNANSIDIIVDDISPSVILNSPNNNTWTKSLIPKLNYTFTDIFSQNATCTLSANSIDLTSIVNNDTQKEVSTLAIGFSSNTIYTWVVTCMDLAGNIGISSSMNLGIDSTKPDSSITLNNTPNSNNWINLPTLISISSTDVSSSGVNVTQWKNSSSGSWINISSAFSISTNLSDNIIYYRSIDNVGNIGLEKQKSFKFDSTIPTITSIITSSNTLSSGSSFTLDVYATDSISGLSDMTYEIINSTGNSMSQGSVSYINGKFSKSLTAPIQNGIYNITLTVSDLADNNITDNSYQIIVDNTLPTINVDIVNGSRVGNDTTLSVAFNSLNNGWYNYSGGSIQNVTSNGSVSIPIAGSEGEFKVWTWANNSAATVNKVYTFIIDVTSPTVTILSPSNLNQVNGSIAISTTATDASGIKNVALSIDGVVQEIKTNSPFTFYYPTTIENDGMHTIMLTAVDNVDLPNSVSVSLNFSNDVAVVVPVVGDVTLGTAEIFSEDLENTPVYTILDGISGLNSSNIIARLIEDAPNDPTNIQLSTVIGKINITADTPTSSIIHITVPLSTLIDLGLSAPYATIAFFVDHGSGVEEVVDFGYLDSVIKEGVIYERFFVETDEYSIFFWGEEGEEVVVDDNDDDDDNDDSSPGGSPSPSTTTSSPSRPGGSYTPSYITVDFEGLSDVLVKVNKEYLFEYNENESHTLTINKITSDFIEFTLESEPINSNLFLYESKMYDLDLDGFSELKITLNRIYNNATKANMTLEKFDKPIILKENVSKIVEKKEKVTEKVKETFENKSITIPETKLEPKKKNTFVRLITVTLIIAIFIGIFYLVFNNFKKKKVKKAKKKSKNKDGDKKSTKCINFSK
jgi:subtilisin family serine protease